MKVLVVHNFHRSGSASGDDQVFKHETAMLKNAGIELLRYTIHTDEFDKKNKAGKLLASLDMFWSPKTYRDIQRICKEEKPDIVHVHTFFPLLSPAVFVAAHRSGVKVIQTLHEIFTIDKSRVKRFVGHLTPEEMGRVDDAVKISLALNPMGSIQKLKPIVRSTAAYAPPEVVDGKPPVYPYTPIKSDFEDAGTVEEMMLYTELQSAVHAMIQRLEYSFTFNPSLLTSPKRKKQVTEILTEAEKYIWRIKEEIRCA